MATVAHPADARSCRGRGRPGGASGRRRSCWGGRDQPDSTGGVVERGARRGHEHARYDADAVASSFAAATSAALVLGEYRAAYRGRSTPVNAWWGHSIWPWTCSRVRPPIRPPMISSHATRWTPRRSPSGGGRVILATARRRCTPMRIPRRIGFPLRLCRRRLQTGTRVWASTCSSGTEVIRSGDPHRFAHDFAQSAFDGFFAACGWDPSLWASAHGSPPPVR